MKILIVDDDKLVSTSLKTIIQVDPNYEVVAIGNDGLEAIALYKQHIPDVLLLDIRMEPMNGLDSAREILQLYPDAKILFLTTFQDDEYIIKALHLGVKGYLLKQNFESILPALNAVYSGQTVFGCEIIEKIPTLLQHSSSTKASIPVSEKEFEIIELIAKGLSNKEISEKLFLSEGTIRNYLSKILEKLQLRDRTQLAIYYFNHRN